MTSLERAAVICFAVAALAWVALLVGCAPRYRADDMSIFARPEVLRTVSGKDFHGRKP